MMNGYDFDKTIYKYDSYTQFYFYVLIRRLYLIFLLPYQAVLVILWRLNILSRRDFKQSFSIYLAFTFKKERLVENFWKKNIVNIKPWYYDIQKEDDLIISASPEFFLAPIMLKLNIKNFMGTRMNMCNGKIKGKNCYRSEKLVRYKEVYGDAPLATYYSDSHSDAPMMEYAETGYFVVGDDISVYKGKEK